MPCLSEMERPDTGGERILVPRDLEEERRSGSKSVNGSDLCFRFYRKEPVMPPSPEESSSIGMNSDEDVEEGESEVQGPLRVGFKASMDSLEEALPMRRGISSFYEGKSKSFASLAEASTYESTKGIVKPETAYSRRRRNLLAHTLLSENSHHSRTTKTSHLIRTQGGGISKKPNSLGPSSSRATLALAVAMANTDTTTINKITSASVLDDHTAGLKSRELGPSPLSPHFPLRSFCHWRSFSLADLQQCQATVRSPDHVS